MFVHHLQSEQSLLMVGGDKGICIPGHDDAEYGVKCIYVCAFDTWDSVGFESHRTAHI